MSNAQTFLNELRLRIPDLEFSTDANDLQTYGTDWTRVYPPAPAVILFPQTTEHVASAVKLCQQYELAIVPSGGRTGLSGGAVATHGEVVITLSKMRRLDPVDAIAQTVRVQAGVPTQAVHEHCAPYNLTWPVDFASKGSSHVGGNIATNAGGVRVIRYGLTRQWVLGLQVVTAQGDILELNGALEKNQTGLDLRQLFIGSEGTLGIVTEATLKLCPRSIDAEVFFFAVRDFPTLLTLFQEARRQPFSINAFEMLSDNCLRSVMKHRTLNAPFSEPSAYYVLMEVEKPESNEGRARLESWLHSLFENDLVIDGVLAQSPREGKQIWELREGISESLTAQGFVYKHDIALPISNLKAFIEDFLKDLRETYHGFELFLFGHIGDGNLHVNIRKPDAMDKDLFLKECKKIDQTMFALVHQHGGSVSAEHGIGLLKKHALAFSRRPGELEMMKLIKRALDPKNIMNPGKIFDL